jgi:hypothetical protein
MAATDIRLRTYLTAFFNDWVTGMSGLLSVPFATAAVWSSEHVQRILWGCLAAAAFVFGSYRVWCNQRIDGTAPLAKKESGLYELRERVASLVTAQQKPRLKITISAERTPPSQVLRLVANRPVEVARVEYMLSNGTTIAAEEVSHQGDSIEIPINDGLLLKVWNTPRADRNFSDYSGPAKIGITVSADGQAHHFVLPVQMASIMQNNAMYTNIIGSTTFYAS